MSAPHWIPYSGVAGMAWPALPPAPGQGALAIQFQLDRSQWLEPEAIVKQQFRQLRQLVRYALERVPHYRDHLQRSEIPSPDAIDAQNYLRWPVLSKRDIQQGGDSLLARGLPEHLGGAHWVTTSGSTGQPLRVANSDSGVFFQHALLLRSHFWYGLDPRDKFAIIRAVAPTAVSPDWGAPHNNAFRTGPSATLSAFEDHRRQLEWLRAEAPTCLLTHNSNLRALLVLSKQFDLVPTGIRTVMGMANIAAPDLAELARNYWNAGYCQSYACSEAGSIALQCPQHEHLHVQSEHVLLEILRPDGSPCEIGEIGRVIITDLHNFAMPLIRYELGDQAAFGPSCRCGRGLPVLQVIAGRTGDLAVDPTGRSFFAHMVQGFWATVAPILQRQIVQLAPDRLEIRYVAEREITPEETARLVAEIRKAMRYDYAIECVRVPEIRPGPGAKFADFVSMIKG